MPAANPSANDTGEEQSRMPSKNQRHVKNYLVLREFQVRYVSYMVAVASLLTAALGWLVLHEQREASRVVAIRALDPNDEEAQALAAALHRSEVELLVGLIVFGVVLAIALAAWQIVTTHRVAGPLYYIAHQARRIRDGSLSSLRPLRKRDLLHGFFEEFRLMHEAMRARARREADRFGQLADAAERAGQTEIAEALRGLEREREEALK